MHEDTIYPTPGDASEAFPSSDQCLHLSALEKSLVFLLVRLLFLHVSVIFLSADAVTTKLSKKMLALL